MCPGSCPSPSLQCWHLYNVTSWDNLFMLYANSKGADQSAHLQSDQLINGVCFVPVSFHKWAHNKTYKKYMSTVKTWISIHIHNLISLYCLHQEASGPWQSTQWTLISLHGHASSSAVFVGHSCHFVVLLSPAQIIKSCTGLIKVDWNKKNITRVCRTANM